MIRLGMIFIFWSIGEALGGDMGSLMVPKELEHAQILDKRGVKIPLDIRLTNSQNKEVILKEYFVDHKKPVIITLGYYGCPMLCTLVLNGLVETLKKISLKAGKDYQIISISIDEKEPYDLAYKKQENYLSFLDESNKATWNFHVGNQSEVRKLADALGFNYYFDKKQNQFAHGAGFFIISPLGVLSQTFYGISFPPNDVKMSLIEAANGQIGTLLDRVILSCFHYDPDSHRYGVYILGVVRIFGAFTILIMALWLLLSFQAEKKQWKI